MKPLVFDAHWAAQMSGVSAPIGSQTLTWIYICLHEFTRTHLASSACDSCSSHAPVGRTDMEASDIVSGTRYCSGMAGSPGWRRHSAVCSHSCWGR